MPALPPRGAPQVFSVRPLDRERRRHRRPRDDRGRQSSLARLRLRRDGPGALVVLADGRYAVTSEELLAVGGRRQLAAGRRGGSRRPGLVRRGGRLVAGGRRRARRPRALHARSCRADYARPTPAAAAAAIRGRRGRIALPKIAEPATNRRRAGVGDRADRVGVDAAVDLDHGRRRAARAAARPSPARRR